MPAKDGRRRLPDIARSSSTSYARIGPGYSDEVTVSSDLTIPTVVTSAEVSAEEDYSLPSPAIASTSGLSDQPSRSSKTNQPHGGTDAAVETSKRQTRNKTAPYSNAQSDLATLYQRVKSSASPMPHPPPHVPTRRRHEAQQTSTSTSPLAAERPLPVQRSDVFPPELAQLSAGVGVVKPARRIPANCFPSLYELPTRSYTTDADDEGADARKAPRMRGSTQTITKQKNTKTSPPVRGTHRSSSSSEDDREGMGASPTTVARTEPTMDLDGVFSTMGAKIDLMFSGLTTALKNDEQQQQQPPPSEVSDTKHGASTKSNISDTKHGPSSKKRSTASGASKPQTSSSSSSSHDTSSVPTTTGKHDGLLPIDEDGFFYAANSNDFHDRKPSDRKPSDSRQPIKASKMDSRTKTSPLRSSSRDTKPTNSPPKTKVTTHHGSTAETAIKKKGSKRTSKSSSSKGTDRQQI